MTQNLTLAVPGENTNILSRVSTFVNTEEREDDVLHPHPSMSGATGGLLCGGLSGWGRGGFEV